MFKHDLAPPHTAKFTKEWFREKRIPVFFFYQVANRPDTKSIYVEYSRGDKENTIPSNVEELK